MKRKTCLNEYRYKVYNKYANSCIATELTSILIGLVYYKVNAKGAAYAERGRNWKTFLSLISTSLPDAQQTIYLSRMI